MKIIPTILLSGLFLLGCSRKESFILSNDVTLQAQQWKGNALTKVHMMMKAEGQDWTFDAKTGISSNLPDGRLCIILYDVQANMGTIGKFHKAHMDFGFRTNAVSSHK